VPVNSWWQRLDAERWVYRVGLVQTTLLVLGTLAVAVIGISQGLVWLALLPGALAASSGWLTVAWRRGRTWSWWVWVVLTGTAVLPALDDLVTAPSPWNALGFTITSVVLLLLCHPRSRSRPRIRGPVPALPTTAECAVTGRGRS
jgi:hypothetical protein